MGLIVPIVVNSIIKLQETITCTVGVAQYTSVHAVEQCCIKKVGHTLAQMGVHSMVRDFPDNVFIYLLLIFGDVLM